MDLEEFAKRLNGRQYLKETTEEDETLAKELGFVIAFGYSDDGLEFRGAESVEIDAFNGARVFFKNGKLLENECEDQECPYFKKLLDDSDGHVDAEFADEGWKITTDFPYAEFNIYEGDELFCQGIVFTPRME